MKDQHKRSALNRLKTVRGHLAGVITMVEDERYCPDVMKQVSALQGSLEKVNRVLLQNHVETCVLEAVEEGRSEQVVDELMETLRYAPGVTGVNREAGADHAHTHDHKEPDQASRTSPDQASRTNPDQASRTNPDQASRTNPDQASRTDPDQHKEHQHT